MKKVFLIAALVLGVAGLAYGEGNVAVDDGSVDEVIDGNLNYFPNFNTSADVNAYLVGGQGGSLVTLKATDSCLAGDKWQIIGIALPGAAVKTGLTDGTAEGCACSHSGGYDSGATVSINNSIIAIAGVKYQSGTGTFPASMELQIGSTKAIRAIQVKGNDACL